MVMSEGKYVVAQYGQWDGYPSGQGQTILGFLHVADMEKFKKKLKQVRLVDDEKQKEIGKFMESIGSKDGWCNMEQSDKYNKKYPYMSRDIGGEILQNIIQAEDGEEVWVQDSTDFVRDSLFCEWGYVVDLDKGTFEVYKGFNKRRVPKGQRFASMLCSPNNIDERYYPIKHMQTYQLDNLPTMEEFLKRFKRFN
jgi:hypothetical protein